MGLDHAETVAPTTAILLGALGGSQSQARVLALLGGRAWWGVPPQYVGTVDRDIIVIPAGCTLARAGPTLLMAAELQGNTINNNNNIRNNTNTFIENVRNREHSFIS